LKGYNQYFKREVDKEWNAYLVEVEKGKGKVITGYLYWEGKEAINRDRISFASSIGGREPDY